uniref:Phosphorylase b kinase regulatory subunit n=1 Tax=Monopterus albus TaxID=43700 RepID=A0A3Q3K7D3_MONAL
RLTRKHASSRGYCPLRDGKIRESPKSGLRSQPPFCLSHSLCLVKTTVLNYQSPTTGLFPVKTCSTCKEAKVRDSLYCAAGAWALAMAYRRTDDDMGRTHELEHSAIKCMRGILYCYMRQADKVEQFKQDPSPSKCLHSVFNVDTGDEVYSYSDHHHLQVSQ